MDGGDGQSGPRHAGESAGTDRDGRIARATAWTAERVDNVFRIARWEVTKNAGGADRRTLAVALLAVVGIAVLIPLAASHGVALDQGIYRVGVSEESPLFGPAVADSTFSVQGPRPSAVRTGQQDLLVRGPQIRDYTDSQKGRAAASEFRATVEGYNDALMREEVARGGNDSAAFPVVVNLTYVAQADTGSIAIGETGEQTLGSDEGAGTDGGDGSGDGSGSGTGGGDGGGDGDDTAGEDRSDASSGDQDRPSSGGGTSITERLTGGSGDGTPSDISPPFPFRSLVLAFVFVLPLNFVIQAYGSTILSERLNRRGELLLVSPVSRLDIIVGKTLPYFLGAMTVATLITVVLRGSHVSVLAIAPLALLFLSATFLGAMFARSFKELTFVTVTITVSLTSYAFVPAIFTDVTPIALISPLTLVVRDLQGQAIGLGQFAFSTLPPTLTAMVLFGLGSGLYREEDMFTQRPIPLKVLDALAAPIKRKRSVALVTAVLLPFVLVAELVVVALLFALGEASIPFILIAVAVIEEIAKSLHVYAGYEHAKYDRKLRTALVLGFFSGLGFFLAEKLALIAQLVDLPDLPAGRAALESQATLGLGLPLPVVVVGLLFAPLVLHVVTATISSVGASRGKLPYVGGLVVAVVVHLAYNLAVVTLYV
jgi:ABC-type Na+ efflux pump permease subunit